MFKSIVNSCYFENKDIWKERSQMDKRGQPELATDDYTRGRLTLV